MNLTNEKTVLGMISNPILLSASICCCKNNYKLRECGNIDGKYCFSESGRQDARHWYDIRFM